MDNLTETSIMNLDGSIEDANRDKLVSKYSEVIKPLFNDIYKSLFNNEYSEFEEKRLSSMISKARGNIQSISKHFEVKVTYEGKY